MNKKMNKKNLLYEVYIRYARKSSNTLLYAIYAIFVLWVLLPCTYTVYVYIAIAQKIYT